MYLPTLIEYIKLTVLNQSKLISEARLREAEISGDRKVPWGSDDHVSDLEKRISDVEYWKNKCPRGSEKRSYYRGVLSHLKNELKSARKTNQSLNEKQKTEE